MDYQELKNYQKIPCLQKLAALSTPPKHLYFAGRWNPDIWGYCVAVVGSRKMTDYGARVVEKIIPQLVAQKQTVVSGFMYGVDQYSHKICIESGGQTVAVLGWGINTKLTGGDLQLAKKIVSSGGLILSEWEEQKGAHWTFPARNRIVAALCQEVIIVEAAADSGSLITARLASKLGKKLWAVPGPITSRTSAGTNNLIASGQAQMWLGTTNPNPPVNNHPILDVLVNEALTADEVARKLNWPVAEIGAQLSLLLLSGTVLEKGGKYYITESS